MRMTAPDEIRDWQIMSERAGDEAIMWTIQWIGGQPYLQTDVAAIEVTDEGDRACFDIPVLGVMPLL